MKAITLMQPWAGLYALGIKTCETRSWATKHRGKIAVHSSAKIDKAGKELLEWLSQNRPNFKPGEYNHLICSTLGCVLGTVEIVDTFSTNIPYMIRQNVPVQELIFGDYSSNRHFWKSENPVLFTRPVPAKGQLSIWNWDESTIESDLDKKLLMNY